MANHTTTLTRKGSEPDWNQGPRQIEDCHPADYNAHRKTVGAALFQLSLVGWRCALPPAHPARRSAC